MPQLIPYIAAQLTAIGIGASTATAIATVVVAVAETVAMQELSQALFSQKSPDVQAMKQVIRQATAPRRRSYGRVCDGGVLAFMQDRRGFLYQIIMAQQGEIDAFEAHYLAGKEVILDADGFVTSASPYYLTYPDVYIATRTGTASSAIYTEVQSGASPPGADFIFDNKGWGKCTGFPESWGNSCTLDGIATTLLILRSPEEQNFTKVFSSGLPAYKSKRRGCKVWDPTDNTQVSSDPSTWKWTMNGPAIVLDLITHPDGMLRLPLSMIAPAIDVWQSQIALANTLRLLKDGGSEPWYQLSGTYELTEQPRALLPKLLVPMDARLYLRADGAVCLDCGQWIEPGLTISDDNIVSYSGLSRGRQAADIRNEIRATYVSPDHLFTQQEADPLLNEASIAVDGLKTATLDCTWSPSHAQTRYRMKIEAARQNPDRWCGTIVTDAYGLKFLAPETDGNRRRNIRFQVSELGIDTTFEILNFALDAKTGNCTFSVVEMYAADFSWTAATDEGTAPALADAISDTSVEDPSSLTVTQTPYTLASGAQSAVFTASMPLPVQTNLTTVLQWRVHDNAVSDEAAAWTDFTITSQGNGKTAPLDAGDYDVRGAWRDSKKNYSDYLYVRGLLVDYTPTTRAITPADFSASTLTVTNPSTGAQEPAVQVSWTDPGEPVVTGVQIEYRVQGTTNSHFSPIYTSNAENYALEHVITGLLPNTTYEWRPIWMAGSVQCTFGDWQTITTPDARITGAQIGNGAVDLAALSQTVLDMQNFIGGQAQALVSEMENLSQAAAESAIASASDANAIRQSLSASYQALQADYTLKIDAAAGPQSALAQSVETLQSALSGYDGSNTVASALSSLQTQVNTNASGISANSSSITSLSSTIGGAYSPSSTVATAISGLQTSVSSNSSAITANSSAITSLNATVGNFSASGLFRVSTNASLNGASSTIAIAAAATSGGGAATAAMYLSAMSDGTSQVIISADQFIVTDGSNFNQPLVFSGGVLSVDNAYIQNLQTGNLGSNAATVTHSWQKENLLGYGNNTPYVEFTSGENVGQPIEICFSGYIEGARSGGTSDGYLIARVMRTTNAAKITSQTGQNALWGMDTSAGAYIANFASSADGWTAISGSGTTATTNAQYFQLSGSGSLGSYMGMQKSSMGLSYNRLHLRLNWFSTSSTTPFCYGLKITFGSTVVYSGTLNPGLGGFVGNGFPYSDFDLDLTGAPGGTGTIKVELEYDGAGTNTAKIDELIFGTSDPDVTLLDELVIGKTSSATTLPVQFNVNAFDSAPPTTGSGAYVGYAITVAYVIALTDAHNKSSWNGSFTTAVFRNAVMVANQIKR